MRIFAAVNLTGMVVEGAQSVAEVQVAGRSPRGDQPARSDDPFKDTSWVALNLVIKFTTLSGLLAVELAVELGHPNPMLTHMLAAGFFLVSAFFVHRSFGMRIEK